jgi:hypothetical protein
VCVYVCDWPVVCYVLLYVLLYAVLLLCVCVCVCVLCVCPIVPQLCCDSIVLTSDIVCQLCCIVLFMRQTVTFVPIYPFPVQCVSITVLSVCWMFGMCYSQPVAPAPVIVAPNPFIYCVCAMTLALIICCCVLLLKLIMMILLLTVVTDGNGNDCVIVVLFLFKLMSNVGDLWAPIYTIWNCYLHCPCCCVLLWKMVII